MGRTKSKKSDPVIKEEPEIAAKPAKKRDIDYMTLDQLIIAKDEMVDKCNNLDTSDQQESQKIYKVWSNQYKAILQKIVEVAGTEVYRGKFL